MLEEHFIVLEQYGTALASFAGTYFFQGVHDSNAQEARRVSEVRESALE
jgi:hypothetical protein